MLDFSLELPASSSQHDRIEWAGERYADLIEGKYDYETGVFIWGLIVGWGDLGTPDERRAYLQMSAMFSTYLQTIRPED